MPTVMNLNVKHFNVRSHDALDSWAEKQILALGQWRQIDEANVRFARLADASPGYQVKVHLVTPGPDLFAEGRDHTLRGAFAKVMKQLRQTLASRAAKRLRQIKSNLSVAGNARGGRSV